MYISIGRFRLPRDLWGQLRDLAVAAGGRYDARTKTFEIPDDHPNVELATAQYRAFLERTTAEREREGAPVFPPIRRIASVDSGWQYGIDRTEPVALLLGSGRFGASVGADPLVHVFDSQAHLDLFKVEYDAQRAQARNALFVQRITELGPYTIANPAAYALHDHFLVALDAQTREVVPGQSVYIFDAADKHERAQGALDDFLASPMYAFPLSRDPHAKYVTPQLRELGGWYDANQGWKFFTEQQVERATALIEQAAIPSPRLQEQARDAIALGAGADAFGFDPAADPGQLARLTRLELDTAVASAKKILDARKNDLEERGIGKDEIARIDRFLHDRRDPDTLQARRDPNAQAIERAGLVDSRERRDDAPGTAARTAEEIGNRLTVHERDVLASLMRNVEAELEIAKPPVAPESIRYRLLSDADLGYHSGYAVAYSDRYVVMRVNDGDPKSFNHTVLHRGMLPPALTNEALDRLIADRTELGISRDRNIIAICSLDKARSQADVAAILTREILKRPPVLSVAHDERDGKELLDRATAILTEDRKRVLVDAERAILAAAHGDEQLAPLNHRDYPMERIDKQLPADALRVIHGYVVGAEQVGREFTALHDPKNPTLVTLLPTRDCQNFSGKAVREHTPVTAACVDGRLTIVKDMLPYRQVVDKVEYLKAHASEYTPRSQTLDDRAANRLERLRETDNLPSIGSAAFNYHNQNAMASFERGRRFAAEYLHLPYDALMRGTMPNDIHQRDKDEAFDFGRDDEHEAETERTMDHIDEGHDTFAVGRPIWDASIVKDELGDFYTKDRLELFGVGAHTIEPPSHEYRGVIVDVSLNPTGKPEYVSVLHKVTITTADQPRSYYEVNTYHAGDTIGLAVDDIAVRTPVAIIEDQGFVQMRRDPRAVDLPAIENPEVNRLASLAERAIRRDILADTRLAPTTTLIPKPFGHNTYEGLATEFRDGDRRYLALSFPGHAFTFRELDPSDRQIEPRAQVRVKLNELNHPVITDYTSPRDLALTTAEIER